MFLNRAERDLLLKTSQELGRHVEECRLEKKDIKSRLDNQDAVSFERHLENIKRLSAIQTWTLVAVTSLLFSALGALVLFLLSHVAFKA